MTLIETQPTSPPSVHGTTFGAVVAEVLSWDAKQCAGLQEQFTQAEQANLDAYTDAVERCDEVLTDTYLNEGSCQDEPESLPNAWIDKLRDHFGYGAVELAWAALARDHYLISEDDWSAISAWWVASSLPVPAQNADREVGSKENILVEAGDEYGRRYIVMVETADGWKLPDDLSIQGQELAGKTRAHLGTYADIYQLPKVASGDGTERTAWVYASTYPALVAYLRQVMDTQGIFPGHRAVLAEFLGS